MLDIRVFLMFTQDLSLGWRGEHPWYLGLGESLDHPLLVDIQSLWLYPAFCIILLLFTTPQIHPVSKARYIKAIN